MLVQALGWVWVENYETQILLQELLEMLGPEEEDEAGSPAPDTR